MQALQNTAAELMDLKARRVLYPEDVGFRYETGGMMEPLRALSADRIRDFHRQMYRPNNLCLVIAGEIDHTNLLDILDKFEHGLLNDLPDLSKDWKRPWIDSPAAPPLKWSTIEKIEFPEEDESSGEIKIVFFGPNTNDIVLGKASSLLGFWAFG